MTEKKRINKNLILALIGIGLQTIGSICTLAAAVRVARDAHRKIKQAIITELSKQLEGSA